MLTDENELLLLEKLKNMSTTVPRFMFLNKNTVKEFSKCVSDIVYQSFGRNKSYETRENIIDLIADKTQLKSELCINQASIHIFIHYIKNKFTKIIHYGSEIDEQYYVKTKNNWDIINETLEQKYKIHSKHKIKSDLIRKWDTFQLNQMQFKYNAPTKPLDNHNLDQVSSAFKQLNAENNAPEQMIIEAIDVDYEGETPCSVEAKMELFHALLNVDVCPRTVLEKLLKEVASNHTQEEYGKFVDHLWNEKDNLQLPTWISISLLINFQYIYERAFLQLATLILKNSFNENSYTFYISKVDDICTLCANDLQLKTNILSVLNKLIELSCFDVRLQLLMDLLIQRYM